MSVSTPFKVFTVLLVPALFSAVVHATAYDSLVLSGGDPNEVHDFGFVVDICDQNCVDNLGGGAEFDFQINIPNANPVGGTPGEAVAPTAEDRYACRAGTAPSQPDEENAVINIATSECEGNVPTLINLSFFLPESGLLQIESSLGDIVPVRYDLQTNQQGRIIGGWFLTQFSTDSGFNLLFGDIDERFVCSVLGGSFENYDLDAVRASLPNLDCLAGSQTFFSLEFAASPADGFALAYNTCDIRDACAVAAKAVPVPIFAAMVLGLGLLGIALFSGSRR